MREKITIGFCEADPQKVREAATQGFGTVWCEFANSFHAPMFWIRARPRPSGGTNIRHPEKWCRKIEEKWATVFKMSRRSE